MRNITVRSASIIKNAARTIPLPWPTLPGPGSHGFVFPLNNGQPLSDGTYEPIFLPDQLQKFSQATLTIYHLFSSLAAQYTYDPSYIWAGRFNIWSMDVNGVDIEEIVTNANLSPWGDGGATGTIHGNKYWPHPKYIAGFRAASTITHGTGSFTLCPMTGWIRALS